MTPEEDAATNEVNGVLDRGEDKEDLAGGNTGASWLRPIILSWSVGWAVTLCNVQTPFDGCMFRDGSEIAEGKWIKKE